MPSAYDFSIIKLLTVQERVCLLSAFATNRSDLGVPGAASSDRVRTFSFVILLVWDYRMNHRQKRLVGLCDTYLSKPEFVFFFFFFVILQELTFFLTVLCSIPFTFNNWKGCRICWMIGALSSVHSRYTKTLCSTVSRGPLQ